MAKFIAYLTLFRLLNKLGLSTALVLPNGMLISKVVHISDTTAEYITTQDY